MIALFSGGPITQGIRSFLGQLASIRRDKSKVTLTTIMMGTILLLFH